MTAAQLIAKLQALPPDLPVYFEHTDLCCCGECESLPEFHEVSEFNVHAGNAYPNGWSKDPVQAVLL